jgi:hypothetical protein
MVFVQAVFVSVMVFVQSVFVTGGGQHCSHPGLSTENNESAPDKESSQPTL